MKRLLRCIMTFGLILTGAGIGLSNLSGCQSGDGSDRGVAERPAAPDSRDAVDQPVRPTRPNTPDRQKARPRPRVRGR